MKTHENICVIGLGFVGMHLVRVLAKKFSKVIGFDISETRIQELKQGYDRLGEVSGEELAELDIRLTTDSEVIAESTFCIVAVPTPLTAQKQPDLASLTKATSMIGQKLQPGTVIVYESTVFPGATEEVCIPILETSSGLEWQSDFFVGYSPERITTGEYSVQADNIVKVVAADRFETYRRIADVYGKVFAQDIYHAPSIKVAEASKVVENAQRDLNIAFANEIAMLLDKLGVSSRDVFRTACTKWNFLAFEPGFVGGDCINVDPYYLIYKAEKAGYNSNLLSTARKTNDEFGLFVSLKILRVLDKHFSSIEKRKVGVFGLSYKANTSQVRQTPIMDIVTELQRHNLDLLLHDPYTSVEDIRKAYALGISNWSDLADIEIMLIAVKHDCYTEDLKSFLHTQARSCKAVIDVRSVLSPEDIPVGIDFYSFN